MERVDSGRFDVYDLREVIEGMKKYVNGQYIEMTAEEIAEFQREATRFELEERTRPLTESEVNRMLITAQINTLTVDDNTALRMTEFYPEWAAGIDYTVGYKVKYNGLLYKCLTGHKSQEGWEPPEAVSMWAKVLTSDDGEALPWEQPESTNGYAVGDKVTYNGKTWQSTVDNNVWEPGVYGWVEI